MTTMIKKTLVVAAMFGALVTAGDAEANRPGLRGLRVSQRAAVREEVGTGMRIRLGRTGPRGVTGFFAGNGRVQKWGVVGPFLGVHLLGERADGPLPPRP